MATRKAKAEASDIELSGQGEARPRLKRLSIRNFRCIGPDPVNIDLDDIVVLVGPNNAGKSSILRAYEVAMSHGSNEGKLQIDDFPNGKVDTENLPQIELETVIRSDKPGERWCQQISATEWLIRERWTWKNPGEQPVREGYDIEQGTYATAVPWGAPNVSNSRRPRPHRIDAFASPEAQTKEIVDILLALIKSKLKDHREEGAEKTSFEALIENIKELQKAVVASAAMETTQIEDAVSAVLSRVFPNHRIQIDAKPETDIEKAYTPFKASPDLLMGPIGGYSSKVSQQGSGARRTLLWSALKYVAESKSSDERPHLLLLDEPEICLHPSAIREAREVLYALPDQGNWQVMVTTHSPIFIDLSKDNTTVIRVDRSPTSAIQATTLYRPQVARLDADDRANLKALNACDPYLCEFFFSRNVVVVEGDTEHTAFSLARHSNSKFQDLHVIRARGKGSIITILKILNQYHTSFGVLHDSDVPTCTRGANPAWSTNSSIRGEIERSAGSVSHVVSIHDFEHAMFGTSAKSDKPYNTHARLSGDKDHVAKVVALLDALTSNQTDPPSGFVRWSSLDDLERQLGS